MKKTGSISRAAPATVDEYFARVPEPARSKLEKLRATIRSVAPAGAIETISYRIPAFKYKGMLVWYAAFAQHYSLFPGASVLDAFADDLQGYAVSKGTVRFPLDKPLPVTLIRKLVKAKVAENDARKHR